MGYIYKPQELRPLLRRGAGVPTVNRNALPRGMVAFPVFVGRRMIDPVRNVWGNPTHASGSYPPDYFGQQTPVGWASRAWYTTVQFSGLQPYAVNKHSMECMVWMDGAASGGGTTRIATRGTEYKLSINGSGQAEMEIYDGSVRAQAGAIVLQAKTLYHIAMIYDGTNCRLYVNGILDGTMASGTPNDSYGTTLRAMSEAGAVNINVMVLAIGDAINVAWSEGEVRERARNPWGHLVWPEDRLFFDLKGGPSSAAYTLAADPQAYQYAAGAVGLSSARTMGVDPLAYNYAAQNVGLTYRQGAHTLDVEPLAYRYAAPSVELVYNTPQTGDTHDGFIRRSRSQRRIEALRQRRDDERLADAQELRAALEAALGVAKAIPAPIVAQAVEAAPKPADVDWTRVADRDEDYAQLSRKVARLTALVQAEAKRRADDEDDEEAMFLMGAA